MQSSTSSWVATRRATRPARLGVVCVAVALWGAAVQASGPPNLPPREPSGASPPAAPSPPGPPNLPPSPGLSSDVTADGTAMTPPSPALVSVVPVLTIERRRRINLIIAGVSTLLAAYTADRLLARDLSQSAVGWVPLVGPWWILSEETARPNPSSALQALLVVDGLVQLSGLVLTITGTFLRYDRVVLRLPAAPPVTLPESLPSP